MKNPHKAIEAIERLVGGDIGMELEWYLAEKRRDNTRKGLKRERELLKAAAKIVTQVYVIAHAEGHCTGHPNWEDKKYKVLSSKTL